MKKIILAFAAIMLTISINAQSFRHYSLNEVNGDTIEYLQKNFIDQKTYFIGKPLSRVLDIYIQDLPLNYAARETTSPWGNPQDATEYIKGISLSWYSENELKMIEYTDILKSVYLDILFEPPYTEDAWNAIKKYDTDLKMVDHLKNYIVKEIKL